MIIKDWTVQAQWDDSKIEKGLRDLDKAFAKVGRTTTPREKPKVRVKDESIRQALTLTRVKTKLSNTITRAKKLDFNVTKAESMLKSRNVLNIQAHEAELSKIISTRLRKEAVAKKKIEVNSDKADKRRAEAQKNYMANLRKQSRILQRQAKALAGVRGSESTLRVIREQRGKLASARSAAVGGGFTLAGMGDLHRDLRLLAEKSVLSGKAVTGLTNKLSLQQKVVKGLGDSVSNMARSYVSAFALIAAAVGTYRVGEELEQIQSSLLAVSGNLVQAGKDWDYIRGQSLRLGMDLTVMSKGFQQIGTAGKAMKFSVEDIKNIFLGAAESSKAFNLSTEDSAGIMRAFVQIMSYRLAPL